MKILVGYDGSNSGKDALALAKKHAKAFDAQVLIVSSLTGGSVTHATEVEHATEDLEFAKFEGRKQIEWNLFQRMAIYSGGNDYEGIRGAGAGILLFALAAVVVAR